MDAAVIIEGLVQAAAKRRLLPPGACTRLAAYARSRGIASLEDLRRWLAAGDGLSPSLARQLAELLPPPDQRPLGAYIPVTHLADGGMGTVWLAASPDQRLVVVKTLKAMQQSAQMADTARVTETLRRFAREARITQQLTHPNIVRCLDSGVTDDGMPFMVLEYVDSGDLRDLVERRSGLTEGLALAILYQVTEGLIEAHRLHLVHRDIKPPNIFVASDGKARLADFGIARSTESTRTMLTMEGAIVGSPLYMSPEQIVTDPNLDIRSDIYALGAVLYFCLAAAPPFEGKLQEVLHKHCTASIPDIRAVRPAISVGTAEIIRCCMQKERDKRYKDPTELASAVARVLVRQGLTPGAPLEEDTRDQQFGPDAAAPSADLATRTIASGGLETQATLAARIPSAAEIESPTMRAGQQTMAVDLSGSPEQQTMAVDLSGSPEQQTMAVDLRGNADLQTMAMDLGGDGSGVIAAAPHATQATINRQELQTMVANLLAEEPPPPPPASSGSSTAITVVPQGKRSQTPLSSATVDVTGAMAEDWLSLLPASPEDLTAVLLWARRTLCVGRLREPPNDLCLRYYPLAMHKETCQRASRQHLSLRYDAASRAVVLEDAGSPNGTMLDGVVVPAKARVPLEGEHILVLGGVMTVWLRTLPLRQPNPLPLATTPAIATPACGFDSDAALDGVVITRPENRPEMAYALVLRQLSVGGPGADLVLAGARTRTACQFARVADRWVWRPEPTASWAPLQAGTQVDCGGRRLTATVGAYPHF